MFLACQKSKVTIKLKFYYSNLKNAVETAKIAVDSCYVLRQFLTPLPSIDFREIRGLDYYHSTLFDLLGAQKPKFCSLCTNCGKPRSKTQILLLSPITHPLLGKKKVINNIDIAFFRLSQNFPKGQTELPVEEASVTNCFAV